MDGRTTRGLENDDGKDVLTREDVDGMSVRGTTGSCTYKPRKKGKNCEKRRKMPSCACSKATPSTRGFGKGSFEAVLRWPSGDKPSPTYCRTGKDMHTPET
eukprot:jgi/Pico_ML_1/50658/g1827.t1